MLNWGLLFVVCMVFTPSLQNSITVGEKWVHIISSQTVRENAQWIVTSSNPRATVKVYCSDFRLAFVPEDVCKYARVVFDDGYTKDQKCGTHWGLQVLGKSSRMIMDVQITPGGGGTLDCWSKQVAPSVDVEEIELNLGQEITSIKFPKQRGLDLDKTWKFRSPNSQMSLQCDMGLEGRLNDICMRDILTVDAGEGPKEYCGGEKFTVIPKNRQVSVRMETFPGTEAHFHCIAQSISGPDPNEYNNIKYPEEDSSEFGVSPGRKKTTCPCGMANKDSKRIINGVEATESKYPFMVSMRDPTTWHFCGGSILTSTHILTAAHCVSERWNKTKPEPSNLIPTVGVHARYEDASHGETQRLKVKEVHIPDGWFAVKGSLADDLAILVLETPIKFSKWVSPVCLTATPPPIIYKYIKAMGWGITEFGNPDKLMEANVQVLDKALCNNNPKETCFKTGKSSSCNGDSGGPYVYVDPETNRYTQVALVSYGTIGCRGDYFIGTNVVYWYSWIESIIRATSGQGICKKID